MRLSQRLGLLTITAAGAVLAVVREPRSPSTLLQRPGVPSSRLQPEDLPLSPIRERALFSQLAKADQAWTPRAEPIPGGGIRYIYKRNSGDPPLTLAQLRAIVRNPPDYQRERQSIQLLLQQLRRIGVRVVLGQPRQQGAAGEWEPRLAVLRIRPDVPAQGSREVLRVLSHEAIHTVQSCRNGSVRARPALLGLPRRVDERQRRQLNNPLYAKATPLDRALEEEAYANQHNMGLIMSLIKAECRH